MFSTSFLQQCLKTMDQSNQASANSVFCVQVASCFLDPAKPLVPDCTGRGVQRRGMLNRRSRKWDSGRQAVTAGYDVIWQLGRGMPELWRTSQAKASGLRPT